MAPRATRAAYARGETDEFIASTAVGAEGRIRAGDSVFCFNFRPDRMREIVRALAEPGFGDRGEEAPGWRGRGGAPVVRRLATMTEFQGGWPYPVAFRSARPTDTLGAVIARSGASQPKPVQPSMRRTVAVKQPPKASLAFTNRKYRMPGKGEKCQS